MDASSVLAGKGVGGESGMPLGMDLKQIFFTNLQLLGFNAAAMEMQYKIPFNKDMFNLPNKAGAEAVLHFLFERLNPTMCRQEFRDCWPVADKKSESMFRKVCCIWLQNIQKEEADAKLPRINASLFLSPGGDKFCHLLFAFSTYVMLHVIRTEHGVKDSGPLGYPTLTSHNKELGFIMETTCNCAAVRHRKRFLETLGQTAAVKQNWQSYADEVTRNLRSLTKDVRELEREKRDQVQQAAQKGVERGSPIPPSRVSHEFDMSAHTVRRAQRVQWVRGLWKGVEGYLDKSHDEREIVSSIVDKTLQKYSIDAANIQISIPHLMLRECEQEIRRRQVDNIYEGGALNLVSVLRLWNLALQMYIQRLTRGGLKDLSDAANDMRSQAHTHQAYLANTSVLREKMAAEVPHRKKAVEHLRNKFRSEVTPPGLGMTAPSPPLTFDPPSGHSGTTPTGPVLQMTPDLAETPEAATDIANSISRLSQRNQVKPFQTSAFGVAGAGNWNCNNSNAQSRLPEVTQAFNPRSKQVRQQSKSSHSVKGKGTIQPRVVRHVSRQSTSTTNSAHKKPVTASSKKAFVSSSQPLASTPEKVSRSQPLDLDRTPVPSDYNNSAEETPRQRAHNILADKIVSAVMHGRDERDTDESLQRLGLESLQLVSPASRSPMVSAASDVQFSSLPVSHNRAATPARRQGATTQRTMLSALFTEKDSVQSRYAKTLLDARPKTVPRDSEKLSFSTRHEEVPDSEKRDTSFGVVKSPVTLVQQVRLSDAWELGLESSMPGVGETLAERLGTRTEADGGGLEVEDAALQNPVAALNEDAFVSHDLIHRSPLAVDIRRMWQDAISDDAENQESSSDKDVATDWLDTDRSSVGSAHTLTPPTQRSPAGSRASASPQLKEPDSPTDSRHDFEENFQHHKSDKEQGEGSSPAKDRHDSFFASPQQTVISETVPFSTSFDDDLQQDNDIEVEHRTVEWEERLSALYDDDEVADDEGERNREQNADDVTSFNCALDDLFQTKTPVTSLRKVVGSSDFSGRLDFIPGRKPASPLIAFSPQNLSQMMGADVNSASSFALTEHIVETQKANNGTSTTGQKSLQTPESVNVRLSPGETSDKENLASPRVQNVKKDFSQASSLPVSSLKTTPSKKVTFSPDNSPISFKSHAAESQDKVPDEEDLNTSGASLLDESFTPFRSGLLVQGKSPGRDFSQPPHADLFQQTGFSGKAASFQDSSENLGESLAAQLSKLRKMTAQVFRNREANGVGFSTENQEEEQDRADGDTTSSKGARPSAVGREHQAADPAVETLDIFDEDDSILLPASP